MNICWVTMRVADIERSLRFYRDILNLTVAAVYRTAETHVVMMGPGGDSEDPSDADPGHGPYIELLHDGSGTEGGGSDRMTIGLEVPSLEEITTHLERHDVPVRGPIVVSPALRFAFAEDPDGFSIQFVERRNPAS